MLHRPLPPPTLRQRVDSVVYERCGVVVRWAWDRIRAWGAVGPQSRAGKAFGSFGEGSIICFPPDSIVNEASIHVGAHTMVGPRVSLSAGWWPGHEGLTDRVISIGDRCLIGMGSKVMAHRSITIGDDVWTGHNVFITDMNHGYEDLAVPISEQSQPEAPISIGDGSWLGHGVIVLPGVTIGRHVVIGAGSVVTHDIPDNSVAVGSPAVVVRRHDPELGWVATPSR